MEPTWQAMPEQKDDLTYVFTLKPNLKFHNGRALTSEDVRYAFDRYLNFDKSVHKTGLSFVDKIEVPDATTVKITTKLPYADTIYYLGGNLGVWISPKEHAESADAPTKMVGSRTCTKPQPVRSSRTTSIAVPLLRRGLLASDPRSAWPISPPSRWTSPGSCFPTRATRPRRPARMPSSKRPRASAGTSTSARTSLRSTSRQRSRWL
jgi:hypothetical protein